MGVFNWVLDVLSDVLSDDSISGTTADDMFSDEFNDSDDINPANGFPMAGGVDVVGNPYGTDNTFSSESGFDDTFGNRSSFDDW